MHARRAFRLPALSLALFLGGCVTFDREVASQDCSLPQTGAHQSAYRYSTTDTRQAARAFKTVTRAEPVDVRWYTLRLNADTVRPCEYLYLHKDLYLERRSDKAALEERRELHTAEGRLIAVKKERVERQLDRTGYYHASVPVPIPAAAPPGKYRVTTRLVGKNGSGKEETLASASAEFRVTAR